MRGPFLAISLLPGVQSIHDRHAKVGRYDLEPGVAGFQGNGITGRVQVPGR